MKKNHKLDESQTTSQVIQLLLFGDNNMLHSEKTKHLIVKIYLI